jgi:hypothetical protein
MELPTNLTDALSALEGARKDLSAFNALTEEHTAMVNQLNSMSLLLQQQTTELNQERSNKEKLLAEIEALRLKEIEASALANNIVANLGVSPVEIQPEQGLVIRSQEDLWKEYNSLPIQERNDFYAKHKATLSLRK